MDAYDLLDLLDTLLRSTVPFTHLHIPDLEEDNPDHVLDILTMFRDDEIPDLTHLEIRLDSRELTSRWEERPNHSTLISSLVYFKKLEVLKLEDVSKTGWDDEWQLEITEGYSFPELKRIELNVYGTPEQQERSVVYTRKRTLCTWLVERENVKGGALPLAW